MSKGKRKVIEIDDDEPDFLLRLLARPIFNPMIPLEPVGHSSVRSSGRRMSPEVSTSPRKSNDDESFGSEETINGYPGEESGETSSPKIARPEKKTKLSGRTLAKNYPIDFMTCTTTVDDLRQLQNTYKIHDKIDLRVLGKNDTLGRPPKGYVTIFLKSFIQGMRPPLQSYFVQMLGRLHLAPGQLNPNGWRVLSGLFIL